MVWIVHGLGIYEAGAICIMVSSIVLGRIALKKESLLKKRMWRLFVVEIDGRAFGVVKNDVLACRL